MKTEDGVSPSVSEAEIWISLFIFILLYAALAAAAGFLMVRYARRPLPEEGQDDHGPQGPPPGEASSAESDTEADLVSVLTY